MVLIANPPGPGILLFSSATPIRYWFAVLRKKLNEPGAGRVQPPGDPDRARACRNGASGRVAAFKDSLPRPLEGVDEIFDLVGGEPPAPGAFTLEVHDLKKRVFEDLKTALRVEDDLEAVEDAVGDADEVAVNGGEREDLVCRGDVTLVHLDLEDRRRIGAFCCKTTGDPDLRGDSSSGSGRDILSGRYSFYAGAATPPPAPHDAF